jgi:phosphate transport system permease protein
VSNPPDALHARQPTEPRVTRMSSSPPTEVRRQFRPPWFDRLEKPIEYIIRLCGWSAIICVFAIFFFVFREAAPMLSRLSWGEFFGTTRWVPNPAGDNLPAYGILAMLAGTLSVTLLSLIFAVPFGLGAAVYISEFATGKWKESLKIIIELLAAIPSIVWGFIGLMVLGPVLRVATGAPTGTNLLNGGIILALMSVPLIVSISEDALRAVPDTFREAGLALGANRWEIVYRVLFPAARSGLLAAVMLGFGRAVGETMAVLMATGHVNQIPHGLFDPIRTMTATIAAELGETANGSDHYRILFIIGIVLFIITAATNVISDLVIKGVKNRNHG